MSDREENCAEKYVREEFEEYSRVVSQRIRAANYPMAEMKYLLKRLKEIAFVIEKY